MELRLITVPAFKQNIRKADLMHNQRYEDDLLKTLLLLLFLLSFENQRKLLSCPFIKMFTGIPGIMCFIIIKQWGPKSVQWGPYSVQWGPYSVHCAMGPI